MQSFSDPGHPVWSILRLIVVNVSILVYLRMVTTKWDTEFWLMIGVLSGTGVMELINHVLNRKKRRAEEENE